MARKTVGTRWDRENRNDIEHNFIELYDSTGKAIGAADKASKEAGNAKDKADNAKEQADYAKAQGDYAQEVADDIQLNKNKLNDEDSGKTYNWLLKQRDGHVVFVYEEE